MSTLFRIQHGLQDTAAIFLRLNGSSSIRTACGALLILDTYTSTLCILLNQFYRRTQACTIVAFRHFLGARVPCTICSACLWTSTQKFSVELHDKKLCCLFSTFRLSRGKYDHQLSYKAILAHLYTVYTDNFKPVRNWFTWQTGLTHLRVKCSATDFTCYGKRITNRFP